MPAAALAADNPKKTVAAIVTEYRLRSHADVIVGRILDGYSPNGVRTEPQTRIVSMYTDQIAEKDMSRSLAAKHGFKIYPTVAEALSLGGDKLAVDAVLLIGEHGNYPLNDKRQKMYPRYELFEQIVSVFRKTGRSVPLFSDKHLSYSWDKAKKMYDWSRELGFPFMAGSSIPVTVRVPPLEIPYGAKLDSAVAVGYGDNDAYGFHTLEALQCMVERRAGGETGIAAVEMITGEAVWRWRDGAAGKWSLPLLEAALATFPKIRPGRMEDNARRPAVFVLEYADGLKGAVYMLDGHANAFLFASKLANQDRPIASHFGFVEGGRDLPHFDGLTNCIEQMFVTGKPVYPAERTLLTTGALAFLFESLGKGRLATPALKISYRSPRDIFVQNS